ncbi:MAG: hypothetical protein IKW62_00645 [Clostridia bacterium]|nr:hypothetical protein [Clostridia bacterium]
MIDIHTHILPALDDGSSNVEESIKMLGMLSNQGVGTVVATPHFYIDEMEPESFLKLRDESVTKLKEALKDDLSRPQIALGAEFQFYSELYSLDCIEDFCISGTNYILVEMPFTPWTKYTYQALEYLYTSRNIVPIIAHLERYLECQNDAETIFKLKEAHALIQISSDYFLNKSTKRKAINLFKKDAVQFIASDAHDTTIRPPIVSNAVDIVRKKLGDRGMEVLMFWEEKLLDNIITF